MQGFEGLTQRISDYQAQREERAAAVKAEEAARQLQECSFAPDINRRRVEAKVGWSGGLVGGDFARLLVGVGVCERARLL